MKDERPETPDAVETVGKWYDRFIESRHFNELNDIQKDKAWGVIGFFARQTHDQLGADPFDWDVEVLEECCLEVLPRKMSAEAPFFEAVAPVLAAFFRFLGSEKLLPQAESLAARAKTLGPKILSAANDDSNWGMAKSFAMGAINAGVDLDDEKAMQRQMIEYNLQNLKRMAELEESGKLPKMPEFRNPAPLPLPNPPVHRSGPKLGRNDPCHCGSGKKYKKCHLPLDEKNQGAAAAQPQISSVTPPPEPEKEAKSYRAMYNEMKAQVEPILQYMDRQSEIEAASTVLESHRDEFDRFAKQTDGQMQRTVDLFSDPRFESLRFSAEDVERAFKSINWWPTNLDSDKKAPAKINEAICLLADKDTRSRMSTALMLHLPDYVNAGKYLEGWMIQTAASLTAEDEAQVNPFLFTMFDYGYQAWADQQDLIRAELMRGTPGDVEQLRTMTPAQIDAWVSEQSANPAIREGIRAINENPQYREQAMALYDEAQQAALQLLERDDASDLLLSREEVKEWLSIVDNRLEDATKAHPALLKGDDNTEERKMAVFEAVLPIFAEIAGRIFTPERIQQQISQLMAYREKHTGDMKIFSATMIAINSLRNEREPAENHFLLNLCYHSLSKGSRGEL